MTSPTSPQLLHADRSRGSFILFLNPALAAVMIVMGLTTGEPLSVVLGAAFLPYVWFTRHIRYEIFQDRLVIHYGTPRIRNVPLADIGEVRLVRAPWGGQDLVVRRQGRGILLIKPSDPEGFARALAEARGLSPAGQTRVQASKQPHPRPRRSRNRKA